MFEFKLPDLGEGVHEAEILKWHVGPGDVIGEDQPLVDVETDKAAVTIPSPRSGTVVATTGEPGDVIIVGQVIAVIDESGGASEGTATLEERRVENPPTAPATAHEAPVDSAARPRTPAAPATRRLARELGVDIDLVPPTGPAGRVMPDDVNRFASGRGAGAVSTERRRDTGPDRDAATSDRAVAGSNASIPFFELEPLPDFERFGPVEREPIRSLRRKIARKMVTSMVVVPHVIHMDEADVTELESFRRRYRQRAENESEKRSINLLAFVVKAVTSGLRRMGKMFNASLDSDRGEIVYKRYYNIGVAADTPRGLIVPVLKGAESKSIVELAEEIRALAEQARAGTIELDDLQGGTFTITNIGPLGGIALAPAINYPEVAILGMGAVQQKPVVRDGEVVVRSMLPLTLSFDHRVADGADAARFVSHLVRLLSDPDHLLVEV